MAWCFLVARNNNKIPCYYFSCFFCTDKYYYTRYTSNVYLSQNIKRVKCPSTEDRCSFLSSRINASLCTLYSFYTLSINLNSIFNSRTQRSFIPLLSFRQNKNVRNRHLSKLPRTFKLQRVEFWWSDEIAIYMLLFAIVMMLMTYMYKLV